MYPGPIRLGYPFERRHYNDFHRLSLLFDQHRLNNRIQPDHLSGIVRSVIIVSGVHLLHRSQKNAKGTIVERVFHTWKIRSRHQHCLNSLPAPRLHHDFLPTDAQSDRQRHELERGYLRGRYEHITHLFLFQGKVCVCRTGGICQEGYLRVIMSTCLMCSSFVGSKTDNGFRLCFDNHSYIWFQRPCQSLLPSCSIREQEDVTS